jgi:hypothetical protein
VSTTNLFFATISNFWYLAVGSNFSPPPPLTAVKPKKNYAEANKERQCVNASLLVVFSAQYPLLSYTTFVLERLIEENGDM